jgi:hypothetical protein
VSPRVTSRTCSRGRGPLRTVETVQTPSRKLVFRRVGCRSCIGTWSTPSKRRRKERRVRP